MTAHVQIFPLKVSWKAWVISKDHFRTISYLSMAVEFITALRKYSVSSEIIELGLTHSDAKIDDTTSVFEWLHRTHYSTIIYFTLHLLFVNRRL